MSIQRRALCAGCDLPLLSCLCEFVRAVDNAIPVLIFQHPHEARQAKGSVRLLSRSLHRCRVVVGTSWETPVMNELLHGGSQRSVLLYPQSDLPLAWAPSRDGGAARNEPTQLVLLDGTWRKSFRLLMTNPALQALPRWDLRPVMPSAYAPLRKARRAGQLSTLEAACAALSKLDNTHGMYFALQQAFQSFVAAALTRASPQRIAGERPG